MEELDKLIEAVEVGDWSGSWRSVVDAGIDAPRFNDAYHGSLDAANALHDALLQGWTLRITGTIGGNHTPHVHVYKRREDEDDPTLSASSAGWDGRELSRAWLIAILKAHRHNLANGETA